MVIKEIDVSRLQKISYKYKNIMHHPILYYLCMSHPNKAFLARLMRTSQL